MIVLIDNFDSFSYNLYQMIGSINPDIRVYRNNAVTVEEIEEMSPELLILSPGPGRPEDAGICVEAVGRLAGKVPILGVCLGHQAICTAYGAKITYAKKLMHGKQSVIRVNPESPVFQNISSRPLVGRYHSLAVDRSTLPDTLKVTAEADDGEVMAVEDPDKMVCGLQFHPESILTPDGKQILENIIHMKRNTEREVQHD